MKPGKGWALRRGFACSDTDYVITLDGDGTYDFSQLSEMMSRIVNTQADMLIGVRVNAKQDQKKVYRTGHVLGNTLLTSLFRKLFSVQITDALSGFRIMSRRFVASFATGSKGFEIETDLNVHAAHLGCAVIEFPVKYSERPEGSISKLRTYRDGIRIMKRYLILFHDAKPFLSFNLLAAPWFILSSILLINVFRVYFETGRVLPSLVVSVSSFLVSVQLMVAGLIAERTSRVRQEQVRLTYNFIPQRSTCGPHI